MGDRRADAAAAVCSQKTHTPHHCTIKAHSLASTRLLAQTFIQGAIPREPGGRSTARERKRETDREAQRSGAGCVSSASTSHTRCIGFTQQKTCGMWHTFSGSYFLISPHFISPLSGVLCQAQGRRGRQGRLSHTHYR